MITQQSVRPGGMDVRVDGAGMPRGRGGGKAGGQRGQAVGHT